MNHPISRQLTNALGATLLIGILSGCGGGSSSPSSPLSVETALAANLADGNEMLFEQDPSEGGTIQASFSVMSETGTDAYESGPCFGTVTGGKVSANCADGTGTEFQLAGNSVAGGYDLTRSDMPGVPLHFRRPAVIAIQPAAAIAIRFKLSFNGDNDSRNFGTAEVGGTLSSNPIGATELVGTFQGRPIKVTGYGSTLAIVNGTLSNGASFYAEIPGDFRTLGVSTRTSTRQLFFVDYGSAPNSLSLFNMPAVTTSPS